MSGTLRVVLVDDSDDIRDLVRLALERDDRLEIVAEATDGGIGLIAIKEHEPDVVLLDLAMPVKDGLEVLAALRAHEPMPVVIVLSGFSSGPPEEAAMEAGAAGYIEKGLSLREIPDRIVHLYETTRSHP
ncbi:MAG TPA: response regulator [Nitriliruptorales bacterium]